jgi:osmotically inducible lipoprotein OsmB
MNPRPLGGDAFCIGLPACESSFRKGNIMKNSHSIGFVGVVMVTLMAMSGCGSMSKQDRNTAIGAGVGAVGGAVLTGGSAVGTVGGAAVGGVIGHEIDK